MEKDKQGAAVLLTLEGAAEEAALELDVSVINSNDGLKSIIQQLDKRYIKDRTLEKFQALEAFDSYQRKPERSINEHIHDLEKLYFKLKSHGTTISEDLLAYKLLKSVSVSPADEKLAKGTTNEFTFVSMKSQLKKIFPDANSISSPAAKTLLFHKIHETHALPSQVTYFVRGRGRGTYKRNASHFSQCTRPVAFPRCLAPQGKIPIDPRTDKISRCSLCDAITHWSPDRPKNVLPIHTSQPCPTYFETSDTDPSLGGLPVAILDSDTEAHETFYETVIFQSDFNHPERLGGLVAEAWNSGVFDSGVTKTVCGQAWFNVYVGSQSDSDHASILMRPRKMSSNLGMGTMSLPLLLPSFQQQLRIATSRSVQTSWTRIFHFFSPEMQ